MTDLIEGDELFSKALITAATGLPEGAASALQIEAEAIKTDSMKRTPVDSGALRASHVVSKAVIEGGLIRVDIGVGGPGIGYAIYVHERTDVHHPVGEHHFLQKAMDAAAPGLAARIAARMKK